MKVGSIVECINSNPFKTLNSSIMYRNGYEFPKRGQTYVVRGFQEHNNTNILLEEIVNKPTLGRNGNTGDITLMEFGFGVDRFRELLPPQDKEMEALLTESFSLELQTT